MVPRGARGEAEASPLAPRRSSAERDILRSLGSSGTLDWVEEAQGIYRGEVRSIMIALADITVDVKTILGYIEGEEGEAETEDLPDP